MGFNSNSRNSPSSRVSSFKLKIFWEIRSLVFEKMEKATIAPERADEILNNLKAELDSTRDIDGLKRLYDEVLKTPELSALKAKSGFRKSQNYEKKILNSLEEAISSGNFDLAEKIMDGIKK